MFGPHFNIVFFGGGGGGSILSESGFIGKYSKIKHTTCNIFVQDCCLVFVTVWIFDFRWSRCEVNCYLI